MNTSSSYAGRLTWEGVLRVFLAELLLVKLPAIGLVTVIVLGVLGEFSHAEFAVARALLFGRSTYHRDRVQVR